jgi:hypothetical protein
MTFGMFLSTHQLYAEAYAVKQAMSFSSCTGLAGNSIKQGGWSDPTRTQLPEQQL